MHPRASYKINNNHGHRHNSDEFITFSSLTPMLATQSLLHNTPNHANAPGRQVLFALKVFSIKNRPLGRYLDASDLARGDCLQATVLASYNAHPSQTSP
jgi:hypothetical protein